MERTAVPTQIKDERALAGEHAAPPTATRSAATSRVADQLVRALERQGVDVVFGIPGGTIGPVYDALVDRPSIHVVHVRHEAEAMFAAAAYARVTGKIGVVLVTSGPGALNCMTGLASAHCDHLPVLVIAGEVPTSNFGRGGLQEGSSASLNIAGMARSISKLSREVRRPSTAISVLHEALDAMRRGTPGPALLTLPLDVTSARVVRTSLSTPASASRAVDDGLTAQAAELLAEARRPLIFAGSGVRAGAGARRLRELAERLQAPVCTTPKGKGVFPESHPLSLGIFGYAGHASVQRYAAEGVDVTLAVGTSLSDVATSGWSDTIVATEHFVQIDTNPGVIGRNYETSLGIVAPAEQALEAIASHIPGPAAPARRFGVERTPPTPRRDPRRLCPVEALHALQAAMPNGTRYTCDIGEHLLFTLHHLLIDEPQGFLTMTGLSSMGSSIPAALGAALAERARPHVAICGDGGFAMSMGALATAVQEEVGIVVAVLNDQRYGMVERGQKSLFGRSPRFARNDFDVASVARGLGCDARTVSDSARLGDAWTRSENRPLVVDLRIDPGVSMATDHARFRQLKSAASQGVDQ